MIGRSRSVLLRHCAAHACVLLWLAATLSGCLCTEVGCLTGVALTMVVPPGRSETEIERLLVEVCRNDECLTGRPVLGEGSGLVDSVGVPHASLRSRTLATGETELWIHWRFDDPAAGDRFRAEVRESFRVIVALPEQVAVYRTHRPNGPYCPPECPVASLEAAPSPSAALDGG